MRHCAPLPNHHADDTDCPAEHKHTSCGKPLHPDCSGRTHSQAVCSCGDSQMANPGKGYVNECRKRDLASHPKPEATGPNVLRALLCLDAR